MQKILHFDSLDQYFDKLDQNLFAFNNSQCKIFCISTAPDQNPLDLIGFPVVGSCRTPAASLLVIVGR
jgi:hypothetical protein